MHRLHSLSVKDQGSREKVALRFAVDREQRVVQLDRLLAEEIDREDGDAVEPRGQDGTCRRGR